MNVTGFRIEGMGVISHPKFVASIVKLSSLEAEERRRTVKGRSRLPCKPLRRLELHDQEEIDIFYNEEAMQTLFLTALRGIEHMHLSYDKNTAYYHRASQSEEAYQLLINPTTASLRSLTLDFPHSEHWQLSGCILRNTKLPRLQTLLLKKYRVPLPDFERFIRDHQPALEVLELGDVEFCVPVPHQLAGVMFLGDPLVQLADWSDPRTMEVFRRIGKEMELNVVEVSGNWVEDAGITKEEMEGILKGEEAAVVVRDMEDEW
jgi:hypothetical protein